jgi:hypothetical protein
MIRIDTSVWIDYCAASSPRSLRNFRKLRTLGITIRKTLDTPIAASCIEKEFSLLYSDRDFDPFVQHLGLRSAN